MSIFKLDPADFYGQAIALQLAVREFRNELTIDICENSPRLVVMATADLERRTDEIVASMRAAFEEHRKANNAATTTEIE